MAISNQPAEAQLSLPSLRVTTQIWEGRPNSVRCPVGGAGEAGDGPPTFGVAGNVEEAASGNWQTPGLSLEVGKRTQFLHFLAA